MRTFEDDRISNSSRLPCQRQMMIPTKRRRTLSGNPTMRIFAILLTLLQCAHASSAEVDFSHDIVPLLKQHCGKCHSGSEKKGGYSINSRESLFAGGESGTAVIAGKSKDSELYQGVRSRAES